MKNDDRKKFARYAGLFKNRVATTTTEGLHKGTLTVGPGRYEIWNAGWSEAERAVKRSAGIDRVLAYPKSQGGLYEVTPANQGKKLIE